MAAGAAAGPYELKPDRWSSHSRLAAVLSRLAPGSRVLDVGVGTGALGQLLRRGGLLLYGLEPQSAWAEAARPYYQAILPCRLEEAPDSFLAGYDAVVCADVLEHLAEPEAALARLAGLASPGCLFVVSLPNVANLWVRLQLLRGRFRYQQRGILDRTHLRFFTRETAVEMVVGSGLRVLDVAATPVPLGLAAPGLARLGWDRALTGALAGLTSLVPGLLGYQFIIRAVKAGTKGGAHEP
ncbi:MAG: class I SAM-dependent methyltransferase [Chloroflexi bacterium]|nr:class I SAM-dependent methyltransferase [Chloroflexota bacterium]